MTRKRLGIVFLLCFGFCALASIFFCFLLFERKPEVAQKLQVSTDGAAYLKAFGKKTFAQLHDLDEKPISITATEEDLNSIIALASRGISRLAGKATITDQQLTAIDERMTTLNALETRVRELVKKHDV